MYYLVDLFKNEENVYVSREEFISSVEALNRYVNKVGREAVIFEYTNWLDPDSGLATNSIFFCFLFYENSLICLEGKSMTPHRGNTFLFRSSQQLPRLRLGPSKGFLS